MRIELHPRLRKRAQRLTPAESEQVVEALQALQEGFGKPHVHLGLGVRRLRKDLFECRAGLRWRIVFFAEKGVLTAYDVMTHNELKAWLHRF